MNRVYASALGWGGALLVVAILTGLVAGFGSAMAVAAIGGIGIAGYHVYHLAKLNRWLADPNLGRVPEGRGIWDEVLASLHRFERAASKREQMLADALARFRRAAQALPDGVVILDDQNRIEWCNRTAEQQLQIDSRKDVGQPIANLIRDPAFIAYLACRDDTRGAPVRVNRGAAIALTLQLIPYGQSQKLLLSRDTTQAERVEKMRRDFVANVSHELRTPLTVLSGFLETVRELKLDPQRVRDYLAMMQEQASRMTRIIDDLLTLSALESSAGPPAEERVATAELIRRLKLQAEVLSGGKHVIELDGEPRSDLLGAESELESALTNLVSNAVRYTPAGGRVRLVWQEGPEGASFSVEDTGIGIPPEHLPRLTERFYRVDRSRSRETGGTGLGLAIAKRALARHDAQLEIESQPGKGSRFTARFPPQRLSSSRQPA